MVVCPLILEKQIKRENYAEYCQVLSGERNGKFGSNDARGSNFSGARFVECNFSATRLDDARLVRTSFENCDLSGVDFRGANLEGVDFHGVLERTRRIGAGPNEVRRHAGGAPYDRTEHDREKGPDRMVPGCPARRRRTGFARFTHEAERQAGRSRAAERLVDQPGARERAGAALFQRRREVSGHRVDQLGARDLELQRRRSTLRPTRARPGRDGRATSATSARCRTAPDSDSTRPAATPACR